MAVTIMGGLFVATFLTLLFVPALYALWNRRSLQAQTPVTEAAEPAKVMAVQIPLAAE
jgi:hypothetical protein